jgi:hypothetical protein
MADEKLLSCPWCTVPPEVTKAAGYGFRVEYVNETCRVAPCLNVTRGRQNAINAWNTRAPLHRSEGERGRVISGVRLAIAGAFDQCGHSLAVVSPPMTRTRWLSLRPLPVAQT